MKYLDAMLAEPASPDLLDTLIHDDRYLAEQKIDGHRCLMHIEAGRIAAVARSGLLLPVKPPVFEPFKPFLDGDARWVFDGEYLAGCYYIFDLIEAGKLISTTMPLIQRRTALEHFWSEWHPTSSSVELLPAYRTSDEKARLVERVREVGGEGVMFKLTSAVYVPGKRSATILKLKFRNEIDCVVMELGTGGKENMVLGLYDESGILTEVAECTRLAGDGPKIKKDDVVTVTYQYATTNGRLFHPTLPKLRHDKPAMMCTRDQLVYVNKTVLLDS